VAQEVPGFSKISKPEGKDISVIFTPVKLYVILGNLQ